MSEIQTQSKQQRYQEVIEGVRRGDGDAETALVKEFSPAVQRLITSKIGGQNEDWQDIVQDVLFAVLSNLKKPRFEITYALPSYVYGIAKNQVAAYLRGKMKSRQRQEPLSGNESVIIGDGIETLDVEKKERLAFLRECLESLKPLHQNVLRLKYFEDNTGAEIQKQLQLQSESKVYDLTLYAKRKLRDCMEAKMG